MVHCSWNVPFMLVKLSNYAQNVLKCVTDLESVEQKVAFYSDFLADSSWLLACMIGLIFAVHAKRSISDGQLIAMMNWLYWMSLDSWSVGCSLSLDSLSCMTSGSSAAATTRPIEQSYTHAKPITTPICRLASHAMPRACFCCRGTHIMPALCSVPDIAYYML